MKHINEKLHQVALKSGDVMLSLRCFMVTDGQGLLRTEEQSVEEYQEERKGALRRLIDELPINLIRHKVTGEVFARFPDGEVTETGFIASSKLGGLTLVGY